MPLADGESNMSVTLGESIKQATQFLKRIHEDTATLITTLDGIMAERGWLPSEKNRVSEDLGNGLDRFRWVIENLYRIYIPQERQENTPQIAAFQIDFDPPQPLDQAICLLVAAHFQTPTPPPVIWRNWVSADRVFTWLAQNPTPQELSPDVLHESFLPQAHQGRAFLVPLCDLDSKEALVTKAVDPLLASVRALSA